MIAIKDMETLPSCCYECPYFDDYCSLTGKWESDTEQIRDKDCPLVEVEERKKGKWIVHDYAEIRDGLIIPNYECTCCHDWVENDTNYCPNCGSFMMNEGEEKQ